LLLLNNFSGNDSYNQTIYLFLKRFIYIFILFYPVFLSAQKLTDSLDFYIDIKSKDNLTTKLEKQLNTYYFNSIFRLNGFTGNFLYDLDENYNSTLINSSDKSIRDEHYLNLKSEYQISDPWRIGLQASNNILSDSRKIEINSASISDAALFTNYSPLSKITISPFLGYTVNRQVGEDDRGMLLGLEGLVNDLDLPGWKINGDIRYRDEDISPRKNTLRNLAFTAANQFDEDVSNNIGFKYYQTRKDFYYAADSATMSNYNVVNNIQSRTETGYQGEDRFNYNHVLSFLSLDFLGRINYRSIDRDTRYKLPQITSTTPFDTRIDELKLEFESNAVITTEKFTGIVRVNYSERDEKNIAKDYPGQTGPYYENLFNEASQLEAIKNNTTNRGSLTFSGNYNFSNDDRLFFSLYQSKLSYDTPSAGNYDTRDEVLSMVRFKFSHTFTPYFTGFVNFEGTYNHVVYIYSENSSNNNVNRVYRLSSGGEYRGKNLTSSNTFEVSANYTVYDFEDINPNYRSFSFRQFNAVDSTTLLLGKKFFISHYVYVKLSEQGDLKWASFSTKPTRFLEEIYSEPKLNYVISKIVIAGGFRLFELNTFTYQSKLRIPESEYVSIGPVTEISLVMDTSLFFRLYGYYEFITVNNSSQRKQASFTMQTIWNF